MAKHTRRTRKTRRHGRKRTHRMRGGNNLPPVPAMPPAMPPNELSTMNRAKGAAKGAANAVTGAFGGVAQKAKKLFSDFFGPSSPPAIGGKRTRRSRRGHKRRSHTRRH